MTFDRRFPRRRFLQTVVVTAGAATLGRTLIGCDDGNGGDPSLVFPLSVASGDPREGSIVLWTRVAAAAGTDAMVQLEVATDEGFASLLALSDAALIAPAEHDHCVRVKVEGLSAGTTYYYRFAHEGTRSRTGRFRTAPARSADVPVRFGLVSCQDYVGRYYNSLLKLLEPEQDDLAFVVHVGDYVYETTGDPSFMMSSDRRSVSFEDEAGAIALVEDGETFYAARSLSNYRELYRTYRSDPVLQQVHEKFAMIVIWDDHEFSDDSWQDVATYTAGRLDEQDTERRRNAEQAFLEYQPMARPDEGAGSLIEGTTENLFPDNRIYRDLRFGQHVHLVMSDYRSFRPDHPIDESAWPGAVVMSEAEVRAVLMARESEGRLPAGVTADIAFAEDGYRPYVDLMMPDYARHQQALGGILTAAYEAGGAPAERAAMLAMRAVAGLADAAVVNLTIEAGRAALPEELRDVAVIDLEDATLSRGLSYASLGKTGLFGSIGSRYLVIARHYDLWAEHRAATTPHPLGDAQLAFVRSAIAANEDATWTVFGSSVSFAPLVLDLSGFAARLPPGFPPESFYLSVDQWDGFPIHKQALLEEVLRPRNALLISGDIHSALITDHGVGGGGRAIELTCPGISSGNFRELLYNSAQQLESLRGNALVETVLTGLDFLLQTARPQLVHSRTDVNGLMIATIDGTSMIADVWQLPPELVTEPFYDRPSELTPMWQHARYRVDRTAGTNGEIELLEG
ncbi:MAG: alkaline phosphatase D family protein [Myxococcota bacterium]|nr:alkaline phosphatase D family protein [Myxococcota bacterium]